MHLIAILMLKTVFAVPTVPQPLIRQLKIFFSSSVDTECPSQKSFLKTTNNALCLVLASLRCLF